MTAPFDAARRLDRARRELEKSEIDVLLVSLGRDLLYLTGYEAPALERLTMAVVPADGRPTLVVPELEAPKVTPHPEAFDIRPWGETEDPVRIVADLAGPVARAAVGDQTWARFLLALQDTMEGTSFVSAAPISRALRLVKSDGEIHLLRSAAAGADRVAARLAGLQFTGRSEREISRSVSEMLIEEGLETAGFAIVASGPNGSSPHHDPGARAIEPGDAVVVDFGGTYGGYHSDTTRMFYAGRPDPEMKEVHDVVAAAQDAGYRAARAGVPAQDVDRAARVVIADAGYGEHFIHRTGHGIGLDIHEDPYLVEGNAAPLAPGMAFSIEPGIYLAGRFGVRIEDIVVIGSSGPERLNRSPREPAIVG